MLGQRAALALVHLASLALVAPEYLAAPRWELKGRGGLAWLRASLRKEGDMERDVEAASAPRRRTCVSRIRPRSDFLTRASCTDHLSGAEKRDRHLTEEGPEALEDRAKALLNLCENLRAEMQERSNCGGQAPLLQHRLDVLRESNQGLREVTRGGTEVYPAVALLQSATRGLNMREEEERRLQAEDDAVAARMQSCCMRAVRRQIYLNARQLPCCARGSVARHEYIQCIRAAEVVKNRAKMRRWMIRLDKMREGFLWEDLEEMEASEREERARLEAEMQEAEEAARLEALREDEERQAAAAAAARRASAAVKEVENLLKEATTDGSDPQQVQELRERVAQAVAEAERESQLLELQAQRVEAWARQHFSENYLERLLDSEGEERIRPAPQMAGKEHGAPHIAGKEHGQSPARRAEAHADVEIISLDLAAAERGASRQTLVRSRHGRVSRHGDRHQVAAKCHAAAAAFDRLELLMADHDASKGDVSAALEALQSAQQVLCSWYLHLGLLLLLLARPHYLATCP